MARCLVVAALLAWQGSALGQCVPVGTWVVPATHQTRPAPEVLGDAARQRVALLGERHTSAEDHRWELQTLAALHVLHPDMVIGFEMFPRATQPILDRWVKGELSETELLEQTDWDRIWGFDSAFYLPLFDFARMHRVPMVALDLPEKERAAAAPHPAAPVKGYLDMLKGVFAQHPPAGDLDEFVKAQGQHDRVLAQSIERAARAHPGALVVGIMGRGHVENGWGVPHQLADLGVREVATLLPFPREEDCSDLQPGFADAVFGIAAPARAEKPLLGIQVEKAEGGVGVVAVQKGSIAERAGLKAGDLLLDVAGREVKEPSEVRAAVERQAPGTWLPLRLRRDGKVIEVVAKFPPRHYAFDVTVDPRAGMLEGETPQGRRWERKLGPDPARGVFLPGSTGWYPRASDALATYDVTLDLPLGQVGLVPGTVVEESRDKGRYHARIVLAHPAEPIDLLTGPYVVKERLYRGVSGKEIRLRTYFHPEIADLSSGYLDSVAGYLKLFEKEIGPYPYGQFSVVSSPTPTGYGMPSLTYLGIEVLKLPFIRATSLGHEVLHDWWGNGVYVDASQGNWSEGLTTFMADYAFKEREGAPAAREMRLSWLRDITAVPAGEDKPLSAFRSRTHETSQIVGYRKAAMVFYLLRAQLGDAKFYAALRAFWRDYRFHYATWTDLRRELESASGSDLKGFFSQWLERTGAPEVRLAAAKAEGGKVRVTLEQGTPPFALRVPIVVKGESGDTRRVVDLTKARESFELESLGAPREAVLDPDFEALRRLAPGEAPPILRNAMVAAEPRVSILDDRLRAPGLELARALFDHEPQLSDQNPTLVIGRPAEVDAWLLQRGLPARPKQGTAQAWMAGDTAVVAADDPPALTALLRPLPHYGAQSFVLFDGARAIDRGVWPARPQALSVRR